MKLGLLNTTIVTSDGHYEIETITLDDAIQLAQSSELESAVGHEATAKIMSSLLGVDVPFNRQQFAQQLGQTVLAFKLNDRAPEGAILSIDEVERIGYTFKKIVRTA